MKYILEKGKTVSENKYVFEKEGVCFSLTVGQRYDLVDTIDIIRMELAKSLIKESEGNRKKLISEDKGGL